MTGNRTLAGNSDFKNWVSRLKQDIRSAQFKAAIKVNTELLRLYWRMGADICEKQKSASWGDGWLKELSRELMDEFPDMKGFSYRNLRYIRQWHEFYNQDLTIWQQAVAKLDNAIGQQAVAQLGEANVQQVVAKINEDVFFSVPWGHHLYIISQCKDVDRAVFYLKKTVENGYDFRDLSCKQAQSQTCSGRAFCKTPLLPNAAYIIKNPFPHVRQN